LLFHYCKSYIDLVNTATNPQLPERGKTDIAVLEPNVTKPNAFPTYLIGNRYALFHRNYSTYF